MSAEVVPFPAARRIGFVRKQARYLASLSSLAAEKQLAAAMRLQRDTMNRKGIARETVEQELKTLELAIRAELWRAVLTPGGAA